MDLKGKVGYVNLTNHMWGVFDAVRGNLDWYPWALRMYPLSLIGYLVKTSGKTDPTEAIIAADVSVETRKYLLDILNETGDELLNVFVSEFTPEELATFLRSDPSYRADNLGKVGGNFFTPATVNELGYRILDVQEGDKVADYGCGPGGFLGIVVEDHPDVDITGIEFSHEVACVARLRMEFMANNAIVQERDLFDCEEPSHYDKIFSNFPFGMRINDLSDKGAYAQGLIKGDMPYGRSRNADWAFCQLIVDSLNDGGKAVGILTPSALYNLVDKRVRQHFVEQGLIEAIVALPKGLFIGTSIPTELIVFSQGNDRIRFVDARELGGRNRSTSYLDDADIDTIMASLSTDGEQSTLVPLEAVADRDYNLQPERYLWSDITVTNGVALGSIATAISRGFNVRSSELEDPSEENEGKPSYLSITDIEDGNANSTLKRIASDTEALGNRLLEDGDIVIARMAFEGGSFKVATVSVESDERIVPSQNLYVVRLDKKRALPTFIAGFLNSDTGQELLSRTTAGENIRNITTDGLRELVVPVPRMADQLEMAAQYQAKLDEIAVLKLKLERARMEAASFFDSEVE